MCSGLVSTLCLLGEEWVILLFDVIYGNISFVLSSIFHLCLTTKNLGTWGFKLSAATGTVDLIYIARHE